MIERAVVIGGLLVAVHTGCAHSSMCDESISRRARGDFAHQSSESYAVDRSDRYETSCEAACSDAHPAACMEHALVLQDWHPFTGEERERALADMQRACRQRYRPACDWLAAHPDEAPQIAAWRTAVDAERAALAPYRPPEPTYVNGDEPAPTPTAAPYDGPTLDLTNVPTTGSRQCSSAAGQRAYEHVSQIAGWHLLFAYSHLAAPRHGGGDNTVPFPSIPGLYYELDAVAPDGTSEIVAGVSDHRGSLDSQEHMGNSATVDWSVDEQEDVMTTVGFDTYGRDDPQCLYIFILAKPR